MTSNNYYSNRYFLGLMQLLCLLATLLLSGCELEEEDLEKMARENPEELYEIALDADVMEMYRMLSAIEDEHPFTDIGQEAAVERIRHLIQAKKYNAATADIDSLLLYNPAIEAREELLYLRVLSLYGSFAGSARTTIVGEEALFTIDLLEQEYPQSKFVKHLKVKKKRLYNTIVHRKFITAKYYMKNLNFIAAIKRFSELEKEHSDSVFVPETLYRMCECFRALSFEKEVEFYANKLITNHGDSIWARRVAVSTAKEEVEEESSDQEESLEVLEEGVLEEEKSSETETSIEQPQRDE